jgi:hypothetical protein
MFGVSIIVAVCCVCSFEDLFSRGDFVFRFFVDCDVLCDV